MPIRPLGSPTSRPYQATSPRRSAGPQSARGSRQPGGLVAWRRFRRMAARGTARSQFRRGPAGPDECALNERERGHSARPLRNHLLGGERRPWRLSLLASGASLLVARPWSTAPRRGRPVRAQGRRSTRARPEAPLGCCGSDHAAEHHGARRSQASPLLSVHVAPPCGSRAAVLPAAPAPHPPHLRLPSSCVSRRLAVHHATGPHPSTAPPARAATQPP